MRTEVRAAPPPASPASCRTVGAAPADRGTAPAVRDGSAAPRRRIATVGRLRRLAGAALLCVLVLAGCGAGDPGDGSVLHRGNASEPESLDLHHARSVAALAVLRDLNEGLTKTTADGQVAPGLAEHWQVDDGGRRYTFSLREDARWSDGEPVTAADFVAGFRRLVNPATGAFYADLLGDVDGAADIIAGRAGPDTLAVTAADPHTLVIRLRRPVPWFTELLSHPAAHPLPRAALAEHGERWARAGTHVSSGAYRLERWVQGDHIRLLRNPHYHRADSVAIDEVRYYPTVDRQAEYNRYRAGELHITANVPSGMFDTIRQRHGDELKVAPYLGVYYYGINLNHPPLADNAALRRALVLAVDRERIARELVGQGEQPAWHFVPPGLPGYTPPRPAYADWPHERRVEEARRQFAESGYSADSPPDLELRYNESDEHRRIAVAVQSMWAEAFGFRVPLQAEEFRVMLQNVRSAVDTRVFRASWIADYQDPHTFLSLFASGHESNQPRYASEAYDALLEAAAEAPDEPTRLARLAEAEARLLDDDAVIPLYFYRSRHLVSPAVQGWTDHPMDIHLSRHLRLAPRTGD